MFKNKIITLFTLILTLIVAESSIASVVDLTTEYNNRITGAANSDMSSTSSAPAGDVNGDNISDLIIGAPRTDNFSLTNAGSAYVIFGGNNLKEIDLNNLGSNGFRIDGANANDYLGSSVASAGDVNNDGFDDVLVSAPNTDYNSRTNSGSVYLVYGKNNTDNVWTSALGSNGKRFDGANADDNIGSSLTAISDINGDNLSDFAIGVSNADNNSKINSGSVYLVHSKNSADLANGSVANRIDGANAGDKLGASVSSAGNGKLIVGAPDTDYNSRSNSGSAYVLNISNSDINLANAYTGFRLDGTAVNDNAGTSVLGNFDFNGDGNSDYAVGSPGNSLAHIVFNRNSNLDLSLLTTNGVTLSNGGLRLGQALTAFDFNDDNKDDVLVGAFSASLNSKTDNGAAYLVLGGNTTGSLDLSGLTNGVSLIGDEDYCQNGGTVAYYDGNGDGVNDASVGGSLCAGYKGSSKVIYGTPTPPVTPPTTPVPPTTPPVTPTPPAEVPVTPTPVVPTPKPVCVGGIDKNNDGVCDPTIKITTTKKKKVKIASSKVKAASGCVKKTFTSTVTGKNIDAVAFYVDGRLFKSFKANKTKYSIKLNPARYSKGVHKVKVRVKYVSGANKKQKTYNFAFQKCSKVKVKPKTTG